MRLTRRKSRRLLSLSILEIYPSRHKTICRRIARTTNLSISSMTMAWTQCRSTSPLRHFLKTAVLQSPTETCHPSYPSLSLCTLPTLPKTCSSLIHRASNALLAVIPSCSHDAHTSRTEKTNACGFKLTARRTVVAISTGLSCYASTAQATSSMRV